MGNVSRPIFLPFSFTKTTNRKINTMNQIKRSDIYKNISFELPKEQAEKLNTKVKALGLKKSEYLRALVAKALSE